MMLYEHAAKEVFSRYGIPVPKGTLAKTAEEAGAVAGELGSVVIKAQVTAGGRGKAGGILTAATPREAVQRAQRILGMTIKGQPVRKVLIEEYKKPEKEMYLGITVDRRARRPIVMASTEGGVDIEEVAKTSPEKIFRIHVNPLTGIHEYQARNIAYALGNPAAIDTVKKLYRVFTDCDCTLAEINPLAQTPGATVALDAKMIIDDSALFRQKFEAEEEDELTGIAKKYGMSYVGLEGDIGCIVNGAGLAMATLDMVKQSGGGPANFMDVRAGASAEQVKTALMVVSSNRNVRAILVNIFGGLTKCDEVARGIIEMLPEVKVPLVVRLAGTNEREGREMLKRYGIALASSTEEAAEAVVRLEHSHK